MVSTDLLFGLLQTSSPDLLFGDDDGSVPVVPSAADLIFERSASTSTANLVFGDDGGSVVVPNVSVTLTATLPPLTAHIVITPRVLVQMVAVLPPMICTATAVYKSEAQRPTAADVGGAWQVATPTVALSTPQHQNTAPLPTGIQGVHQEAQPTAAHIAHHLPDALMPSDVPHASRHQDAHGLLVGASIWQQHGIPTVARAAAHYQDAHGLHHGAQMQSQDGIRRAAQRCTHWQTGQRQMVWRKARYQVADPLHAKWVAKNKEGVPPPPGISLIPLPPTPQPCYMPNPHLLFADVAALDGHLVFVCGKTPAPPLPEDGVTIPVRKVYIVIHNATLTRLSDGVPIHTSRMTISLDADSWAWRFTSTLLGRDALALVEPSYLGEPVILVAHINGHTWHIIVDSWTDNRQFGQSGINISGRGLTSDLAHPYQLQTSGVTTSDMTMQQVLNAHLPFGEGWSIVWASGTPDWLVPAGAWSWSNQSPMQAIFNAAQSVGLIVVPAKASKTMTVMPRYPLLPWEFDGATPALTVPDAAILSLNRAQTMPTQANVVYVHGGETGGVIGQVKRALSAGDRVAPTQSSPLITDIDAARLLGGRILASQHRQPDTRSVTMPMGGVFTLGEIGQLLHIDVGSSSTRGIINSVRLDVSMSGREMMVHQTLTLGEDTQNSWARFKRLIPDSPLLLGQIVEVYSDGTAYINMLGGGSVRARGIGAVGQNVYVKNGQIEAVAPALPSTLVEV